MIEYDWLIDDRYIDIKLKIWDHELQKLWSYRQKQRSSSFLIIVSTLKNTGHPQLRIACLDSQIHLTRKALF